MLYAIVLFGLLAGTKAVNVIIINKAQGPVWIGTLTNDNKPALANGGFALQQNEERTIWAPDDWAGRFWARTWCNPNTKHCETGDCGNRLECSGAGGVPPVTLAEFKFAGWGNQDFYDISLVDGFNLPASIQPIGGSGNCRSISCNADLNPSCPNELRLWGSAGYTIGCKSSCLVYNTDQYCCRGQYGPKVCNPDTWAVNSAAYFKRHCPTAYSYAYDDPSSTFTCSTKTYRITFG